MREKTGCCCLSSRVKCSKQRVRSDLCTFYMKKKIKSQEFVLNVCWNAEMWKKTLFMVILGFAMAKRVKRAFEMQQFYYDTIRIRASVSHMELLWTEQLSADENSP